MPKEQEQNPDEKLVTTGIVVLDELLGGGIPKGATVLLQGPATNEKDAVADEFVVEGLRKGEGVIVILSMISPDEFRAQLKPFGIDTRFYEENGLLKIIDWYSYKQERVISVEEEGAVLKCSKDLLNVSIALNKALASLNKKAETKRAVVNILSTALNIFDINTVYNFTQKLRAKFRKNNITSLVLIEKEAHEPGIISSFHYVFDGIIDIEQRRIGTEVVCEIGVLSLAGATFTSGYRRIRAEKGMVYIEGELKPKEIEKPLEAKPSEIIEKKKERDILEAKPSGLFICTQCGAFNSEDAKKCHRCGVEFIEEKEAEELKPSIPEKLAEELREIKGELFICTQCGAFNSAGAKKCAVCGIEFVEEVEELPPKEEEIQKAIEKEVPVPEEALSLYMCTECGAFISPGAKKCSVCGSEFAEELVAEKIKRKIEKPKPKELLLCPECGAFVSEESDICSICGTKFKEELIEKELVPFRKEKELLPEAPPKPKYGLINSLIERRRVLEAERRKGLVNVLRGRINGLKYGRINGLINSNGLINGKGLMNGNGLLNGNGFIYGKGPRFRREVWLRERFVWQKILVVLIVVAILVFIPIYMMFIQYRPVVEIKIDGDFGDWMGILGYQDSPEDQLINNNLNLLEYKIDFRGSILSFYLKTSGTLFFGKAGGVDSCYAFIDADQDSETGYYIKGIGADYLVGIYGWNRTVGEAKAYSFNQSRSSNDWLGFVPGPGVAVSTVRTELEAQLRLDEYFRGVKTHPKVLFYTIDTFKNHDISDAIIAPTPGALVITQTNIAEPIIQRGTLRNELLRIELKPYAKNIILNAMKFELLGDCWQYGITLELIDDETHEFIGDVSTDDGTLQIEPLRLYKDETRNFILRANVPSNTPLESTLGLRLKQPSDIEIDSGTVTLFSNQQDDKARCAYIGNAPSEIKIDGAFADWNAIQSNSDMNDDVGPGTLSPYLINENIDLRDYRVANQTRQVSFYMKTDSNGTVLGGSDIPSLKIRPSPPGPPTPPGPQGPPSILPKELKGEDWACIFIDSGKLGGMNLNNFQTGIDYVINITGRNGIITSSGYCELDEINYAKYLNDERFKANATWSDLWDFKGKVEVGIDRNSLETQLDYSALGISTPNATINAYFYMNDWMHNYDWSDNILYELLRIFITRHFANANGGFSFISGSGTTPTIDGVMSAGEWTDAKYDTVTIGATNVMTVYLKNDSNYLYICVNFLVDNFRDNGDYCEVCFDTQHNGGTAPQTDDKKIQAINPSGSATVKYYTGTGTVWGEGTVPSGWTAQAKLGANVVYEFRVPLSDIQLTSYGNVIGMIVHVYDAKPTTQDHYWWPDYADTTSNTDPPAIERCNGPGYYYGDLTTYRSKLIINRLDSYGSGNDEWLEIYNTDGPIDPNGIVVTDQDGNTYTFTSFTFPANSKIILKSGTGTDDFTFVNDVRTMYATTWTDTWTDAGDDVLIRYGGNGCILDYIQYGSGAAIDPLPADTTSTTKWDGPAAPVANAPTKWIYLYPSGSQSDSGNDWRIETIPTVMAGNTTVNPASINVVGKITTTISCNFTDEDRPGVNAFTVTFKIRNYSTMFEYTLVNAQKNGFGGLTIIDNGGGSYTARYTWDPRDDFPTGLYDLYFYVEDGLGGNATDGFDNNRNELNLWTSNRPPTINAGNTSCAPSSIEVSGSQTTNIWCRFYDPDRPAVSTFRITFKVRNFTTMNEYTLVNGAQNGTQGLVIYNLGNGNYNATYTWDPPATQPVGYYDLYCFVNDTKGGTATDGFNNNRDELYLYTGNNPPTVMAGNTTCKPTTVEVTSAQTTTIWANFIDIDDPDVNAFKVTFKVRDPSGNEYTLVNNQTNGNGGLTITSTAPNSYNASYVWDPPGAQPTGAYDLYFYVNDQKGGEAIDSFSNNLDELTLTTTNNPPTVNAGNTTCTPSLVNRIGAESTLIRCTFYDSNMPGVNAFKITFKVRNYSTMTEYTLVNNQTNGNGGLTIIDNGGGSYTAEFTWDPQDTQPTGKYDLYTYIDDQLGGWAIDGFNNNRDELTITSTYEPYGFGIVAVKGTTPTIDGKIGGGEWTDAKYDIWDAATTGSVAGDDYKIYVKRDSTYLYVCFDYMADTEKSNGDYCEIVFDPQHNMGTLPQTDDRKLRVTNPGASPTITYYVGTGSGWTAIAPPAGWTAGADLDGTHMVYEFRIPLSDISFTSDGKVVGMMTHAYDASTGGGYVNSKDHYWWPYRFTDNAVTPPVEYCNNPSTYGDLAYDRFKLVINEVSSYGSGSGEWIELYNNGTTIDARSIIIMDQDGDSKLIYAQLTLAQGDYILVHTGTGTDESDVTGKGANGVWDIYVGGTNLNIWNDTGDDVYIKYVDNNCGIDYMQYGTGSKINPLPSDTKSNHTWIQDIVLSAPGSGQTLIRWGNGYDTNKASDWNMSWGSYVTPGGANQLPPLPEFQSILIPLGIIIAIPVMIWRRRKKSLNQGDE